MDAPPVDHSERSPLSIPEVITPKVLARRILEAVQGRIRSGDLFFLAMIILLGMKVNWGTGLVHDIHLSDETFYLLHGIERDFSRASMSPLFSGWFFLLSLLQPDQLDLYFLNWFLLPIMMAVGVYLLIRSLGGASLPAFLGGAVVLLSRVHDVSPRPMHFAASLVLVGLAAAFACRQTRTRLALATLTLGFASYARPEFALSFLAVAVLFFGVLIRDGYRQPRQICRLAALGLFTLLPVIQIYQVIGNPLGGPRSSIAFSQHYALSKFNAGLLEPGARPLHQFTKIVEQDFGVPQISVWGALTTAPEKFAAHVSRNTVALFANFRDIAVSVSDAVTYLLWGYLALLLFAAIAVAIVQLRKQSWWQVASRSGLPALVALIVAAPTLAACLVIYPREHYLVWLLGMLLVGATALAGASSWRPGLLPGLGGLAAAAILLGAPNNNVVWNFHALVSPAQREIRSRQHPLCQAVELIRETPLEGDLRVFECGHSRFAYADYEYVSYPMILANNVGFAAFLEKKDINTVLFSPYDQFVPVSKDPDYQAFRDDPPPGWVVIEKPGVAAFLVVRRDALAEPVTRVVSVPANESRL